MTPMRTTSVGIAGTSATADGERARDLHGHAPRGGHAAKVVDERHGEQRRDRATQRRRTTAPRIRAAAASSGATANHAGPHRPAARARHRPLRAASARSAGRAARCRAAARRARGRAAATSAASASAIIGVAGACRAPGAADRKLRSGRPALALAGPESPRRGMRRLADRSARHVRGRSVAISCCNIIQLRSSFRSACERARRVAGQALLLLRHNRPQRHRSAPGCRASNDLGRLAQWPQLLDRPEKVPMAGKAAAFPCQLFRRGETS